MSLWCPHAGQGAECTDYPTGCRSHCLYAGARLGQGVYMVGAHIGDGRVVGVMEGRQPVVKVFSSKPDALGRSFGQDTE